jgi:hypothetical protein
MGKNTDDRRGFTKQKTKMTAKLLIASVAAAVSEDRRMSIQDLARAHGTISRILHSQLGLIKKSACWVPKLLSKEQKESENIEGVCQTRPDKGVVCAGSNYYHGRVICLHAYPRNEVVVETVDKKRHS